MDNTTAATANSTSFDNSMYLILRVPYTPGYKSLTPEQRDLENARNNMIKNKVKENITKKGVNPNNIKILP